jgi:hypothetical protein
MQTANERYFAFMACLDNPDAGQRALAKMAAPAKTKGRSLPSRPTKVLRFRGVRVRHPADRPPRGDPRAAVHS